jgi:hypothetical protein
LAPHISLRGEVLIEKLVGINITIANIKRLEGWGECL